MTAALRITICRCSLAFALLAIPCLDFAETRDDAIRDTDVCQILSHPDAFDGQLLRFRGRLEFEFEGYNVDDTACALPLLHTSISWAYGGESLLAPAPEKGHIESLIWPVLRTSEFDTFQTLVHAHRPLRPDGQSCNSHRACAYYDVVATYTGRFFAGKVRPGHTRADGFGHMGCCHLFVIEQISDVNANRTTVPEEDQKFLCTKTAWQSEYSAATPQTPDERSAANKQFLIEQLRTHGDASLVETMEPDSPWSYLGLTGRFDWSSSDLLTTYSVRFPETTHSKKAKKQHAMPTPPIVIEVSKERCEPSTM